MQKIKKIIKLMLFSVLFFAVTLSFSACAQVRTMTITNEDNTIDEIVSITINPAEVVGAGYNIDNLKNDISAKSQDEAHKMKQDLNTKIFQDLLLVNDSESIEILNSYKDGIDVIKSDWSNNSYAIGIRFKNIDVYRYYYNITENSKVEMQTEKHFFYDKLYYYSSTMYVKHNDLYDRMNLYYSVKYPTLVSSEDNQLLYSYRTTLRRQHSDADYITQSDGYYYHTWVVDKENLDEPIMLYYNVANPESWIIVSLCVTLSVTAVLLFIGIIISLTKKKTLKIKKEDD